MTEQDHETGRQDFERAAADYRQQGAEYWAGQRDEYAAMIHKAQEKAAKADRRDDIRGLVALLGALAWMSGGGFAIAWGMQWLKMPVQLQVAILVALTGKWIATKMIGSMKGDDK